MVDRNPACLNDEQLEALAAGDPLDGAARNHGESCPQCRSAVNDIRENNAFLVSFRKRASTHAFVTVPEKCPTVPGYIIESEIHRGGQGVVYRAIQESTRRQVAIKFLREGPFDGVRDRARFEREVQILGRLNHPNIVTIHDSGSEDGRFYLVMSFVPGEPLHEYVRNRRLNVKETLELFVRICDAVSAAHLLGIVHRDLKPNNILVVDDAPSSARSDPGTMSKSGSGRTYAQPKILDFGLAKLTDEDDLESMASSGVTLEGQFMGSLPWASPEQAEGNPNRIDLRTDVYSLGVVLYQMLTDGFPYNVNGNVRAVLDRIVQEEPSKPSRTRLGLDSDVDTIVLKALSKDKERRYQSVEALRQDTQRFLNGEPIDARRDSTWYVLRKTAGRHRGAVVALTAILALLITFASTMAVQVKKTRRERDAAAYERTVAQRERDAADRERQTAIEEENKAKQIQNFMQGMLAAASPGMSPDPNLTVRAALDRAAQTVDKAFDDQPAIEAAVRNTISDSYSNLGLYKKAQEHAEIALAIAREHEADRLIGQSLYTLAGVHQHKSEYEEAERYSRESLAIALQLYEPPHENIANCMNGLAAILQTTSQLDEADRVLEKTLAMRLELFGDEHEDVADTLNLMAGMAGHREDYKEEERLRREVIAMRERLMGRRSLEVAYALEALSEGLHFQNRFDEAEACTREALEIQRYLLGEKHPHVAEALVALAPILKDKGDYQAALATWREALALARETLGEDHTTTAMAMSGLGNTLRILEQFDEAAEMMRGALAIFRVRLGEHPNTASSLNNLALILHRQGDLETAEPLYREAIEMTRKLLGPRSSRLLTQLNNLTGIYFESGDFEKAAQSLGDIATIQREVLPPNHWKLANSLRGKAICLLNLERFEESEKAFLECYEIVKVALDRDHVQHINTIQGLVMLYRTWGKADKEAEYLALLPEEHRNNADEE